MPWMNGIREATFDRFRTIQRQKALQTGRVQSIVRNDFAWIARFVYKPVSKAQARLLLAAINAQQGLPDPQTMVLWHPDFGTPSTGLLGPYQVNGGGQTGRAISIKGAPANTLILRAGDMVDLASGSTKPELFRLLADATTNGSGIATLSLDMPMRRIFANNDPVRVNQPRTWFSLTAYTAPTDVSGYSQITIEAEEAL